MKISVIIPSAGYGKRFGELKQFKLLNGKPLICFTIRPFLEIKQVVEIIIVVQKNKIAFLRQYLKKQSYKKSIKIVEGGEKRQDSIRNGMKFVIDNSDLICIHDAVRPFITKDLIKACFRKCKTYDGAILGLKSTDTVKYSKNQVVNKTIDRNRIWLAQTPQVFQKKKLIKAIKNAQDNNLESTDESFLMENIGFNIKLVEGHVNNIKITFNSDWNLTKYLMNNIK